MLSASIPLCCCFFAIISNSPSCRPVCHEHFGGGGRGVEKILLLGLLAQTALIVGVLLGHGTMWPPISPSSQIISES